MIKVKTSTGFEAEMNEKKVSDYRFLEYTVQSIKGEDDYEKITGFMGMVDSLFSKEDKKRLIDHVAEANNGICDINLLNDEFKEIFETLKENKNTKNS